MEVQNHLDEVTIETKGSQHPRIEDVETEQPPDREPGERGDLVRHDHGSAGTGDPPHFPQDLSVIAHVVKSANEVNGIEKPIRIGERFGLGVNEAKVAIREPGMTGTKLSKGDVHPVHGPRPGQERQVLAVSDTHLQNSGRRPAR